MNGGNPRQGKYSWNWAEMDSNVVRIILISGVSAVWKEIDRKCTCDDRNLFASSVLTIFSSEGKKNPYFNVKENRNDRGKWHLFLRFPVKTSFRGKLMHVIRWPRPWGMRLCVLESKGERSWRQKYPCLCGWWGLSRFYLFNFKDIFKTLLLFIYFWLCWVLLCGEQELLSSCEHGLLIAVASLVAELGLQGMWAQ